MVAISKGDYVLVTGASGFIAAHTVKELLDKGYKVRGTVRSKAKGEYLVNLFKTDKFDYVIAEDITTDGVFDEAVKGVDAVAHTASPFYTTNVSDPQELIGPATKGTMGILKSIQKSNPIIKRIVITSSVASIMNVNSRKAPVVYTEKDWNTDAPKAVEEKGKDAPGGMSYQTSKVLAEKSLWKFIEDEKPSWDGVAINPPLVIGEVIHQCESADKLNTSVSLFHDWAAGKKSESDLPAQAGNWVNVKDVARGHVLALETPEAGGERFITGAGPFAGQDYCDVLHKRYPDIKNVPVGKPNTHDEICKNANVFDGSKATKVLGLKYESFEDTTVEMYDSLKKRGFL